MEEITIEVYNPQDLPETTNENQYLRYSQVYAIEEEPGDGENLPIQEEASETEGFQWNRINTLFFLDEFQKRFQKYSNPSIKKKNFWKEIADVMRSRGQKVNGDILDRKVRNMKSTFNKIKDNNKRTKTGRGRIQWEYFDKFNEIFTEDKTVNISNIISCNTLAQENYARESENNVVTPVSTPAATPLPSPSGSEMSSNCREKQSRLDSYRKRQIELDEQRVEELKKIRLEISESNRISREKLQLFQKYLEKQNIA